MRKILGFVIVFITLTQSAFAGASLNFSEKVKNLGTIEQFKKFKWEITVENISDKPVSFTKIKTTCGCTVAKPEKNTLLPGEKTKFIVHFNSEYFEGHIEKLIFIDTSTKERYVLRIIANVQKSVYLTPNRVNVNTKDDYIEQLIEVKAFNNPEKVKILKVNLPKVKGISYEITGNRSFVLKVNPSEVDKEGLKIATVILKGNYKPLKLFINIKRAKLYTVTPSDNLLFLNIKKGKSYTKTVYINSKERFNILTKKSNVPFAKIKEIKKISENKWKVTVVFDSSKTGKMTSGKTFMTLKTDNGKMREIKLAIVFHIIK